MSIMNRSRGRRKDCREAQTWSFDFIIGTTLFVIAGVVAVKMLSGMSFGSGFEDVKRDAEAISEQLMSRGIPYDWTNETVLEIGLLTGEKLDRQKWDYFSSINHSRAKLLFGVQSEYSIMLWHANASINATIPPPCLVGFPILDSTQTANGTDCSMQPNLSSEDNVVKLTRIAAFNGTLMSLTIYVWA